MKKNNSWNESKKYIAVLQGKYSKSNLFQQFVKKYLMEIIPVATYMFSKKEEKRVQNKKIIDIHVNQTSVRNSTLLV